MSKLSEILKSEIKDWRIEYRAHATRRMFQRDIEEDELLFVLRNGQIIESYAMDFPFPSVLVSGRTPNNRPLHVVAAADATEKRLYIITTYEPDPLKWTNNFERRME